MDLPTFDLRLLAAFSAVADELHFGRAAARLGMAQPKLSQQVGRLERQLGAALLDRSGGRVALTPSGSTVLAEGRAILARAGLVATQLRHERTVLRVHLGDAAHPLVDAVATAFTTAHPTVEVRFTRGANSDGVRALADGRADVAFDQPGGAPPGMPAAVLDGRPLGVACAPGHRLAQRSAADWADLEGESILLPPAGVADACSDVICRELRHAHVSVTTLEARTNSYLCLGPLISGYKGLLICAEYCYRRMPPGLVWRPLLPERELEIAVIWDDRAASVAVHRFVEQAKAMTAVRGGPAAGSGAAA